MSNTEMEFDLKTSIVKHVAMLTPSFPRRTFISMGDYSSQLLQRIQLSTNEHNILTVFIEKSQAKKIVANLDDSELVKYVRINSKVNIHYWFNVKRYITNSNFLEKLRDGPIEKLESALMITSTAEGIGSAFLPELSSFFGKQNVPALSMVILPSKLQPPDANFNALWSMAASSAEGLAQILIDRDSMERYIGVDRKGCILKGDEVISYILELILAKDIFVHEFYEHSKTFGVKLFTLLLATGASLRLHGTLENILNTTMLHPLSMFDLTSASILYVVVRMPTHLQNKISQGKIELTVEQWFKDKSKLKSVHVSQPILVEDGSDRIDILMFVGGFSITKTIKSLEEKVKDLSDHAVGKGFLKEKEWHQLVTSLLP